MRRFARLTLAFGLLAAAGARPLAAAGEEATIYRDDYGIPHVFAPTLEAASFAVGYAQAEDRLEELLKNYRRAAGTMAEAFGPSHLKDDLTQRMWRHAEISREGFPKVSPKLRGVLRSYMDGVTHFMKEHPEQVPPWAQELHPWDSVALSRYIIWGWPLEEAVGELRHAGIELTPPAYRGSNEMLIAPGRTAMNAAVAVIDPHLNWYGAFRFYEVRIYAEKDGYNASGVAILGNPLPSLGHGRYCSVAMTTGGPDTSDVYEEEINPENPRQYRYDGAWRDMTVRTETIGVKQDDKVSAREVDLEYTHHGPVVARKGNKAYTIAIPYMDEVGLADQTYELTMARDLDEAKKALGRLQLMAQNVMIATTAGDIYYVRNGRVPIRARGVDPSRPVPGHTSSTEWRGIHPFSDLVQITNPPAGWMQNCNISPFAMMKDSPLVPEKYKGHPYLYNNGRVPPHQRAAMMNEILEAATAVTIDQAIDIAFHPQVYHAELWQARLKAAWEQSDASARAGDPAAVVALIGGWDRRSDPDSAGALAFFAFKRGLGKDLGAMVDPPADLGDERILEAVREGAEWLKSSFGEVKVPYGRYFRVGREGGKRTWPVGGGSVKDQGMATPRAISFDPSPDGKTRIGRGGQTSTQVVIMTDPPQSFAVIPLGESDHEESGHWDDQARTLFSKGKAAPTYYLNRSELMKHVTAKKVIKIEPAARTSR